MSSLGERQCVPCDGSGQPLNSDRVQKLLQQVPGWQLSADGLSIQRTFDFKGFQKVMGFINAIAWIAHQQGHHPDFSAGFSSCAVTFSTHAINGLSENDFICAFRVNALLEN